MNLLNLLTKEKRVAGIEISDSVVRIVFLRPIVQSSSLSKRINSIRTFFEPKTTTTSNLELVLIEEPLAANIIVQGVVMNTMLLGKALSSTWAKAKLGTDYAIVAIPDDKIYSRIFSFPKAIGGERLTEAMNLAVGFQLPMKTEDVYLDWESTQGDAYSNEILLSTIPRSVANGYIEALDVAGIKALAIESHLASIARAIKLEPERIVIFTKKSPDGTTIFALKNGLLRFSRTLPSQFISEDKIPGEVEKIRSALEAGTREVTSNDADKNESIRVQDLLSATVRDDYARYPGLSDSKKANFKWLVAIGTSIRGQIPEGEDNIISLLPLGTEEAYTYQKAATFVSLVSNITVGVSIFFVVVFISTYLFMLSLLQGSIRTIAALPMKTVQPEFLEKVAWVEHVNALTETAAGILSETPIWSTVIDEINARTIDGVVISNFTTPSITEKISLTGIAKDRVTLNQFKKSFQESALFSEIDLPATDPGQKGGVPFTISFRLKNPSAVYWTQSESLKIKSP